MSEFANALAEMLTKMDQKLDALGEQQKALDAKIERYSAYLVKKMNDTSETVSNVQTAQAKLVTDAMEKIGHQVDAMERQIAGRLSPDEANDAVAEKLNETAAALQQTMDRSISLIGYHGNLLQKELTAHMQTLTDRLEADAQREQEHSRALSAEIAQAFSRLDEVKIVNPEAVPENPDAVIENPEIAVFEKPEAVIEIGEPKGGAEI